MASKNLIRDKADYLGSSYICTVGRYVDSVSFASSDFKLRKHAAELFLAGVGYF